MCRPLQWTSGCCGSEWRCRLARTGRFGAAGMRGEGDGAAVGEGVAWVRGGVHEREVRTGDTTVVIGCGPIGLMFVRMLTRRGVRVIALARREGPLAVARKLGAVAAINVTETADVAAAVRALNDEGPGAGSGVEAAGNPATGGQGPA